MDTIWSDKPLLERNAYGYSGLFSLQTLILKTEVALSCHNYTIPKHILENARKNKLSCSEYIPSSGSFTVSDVDIHFVMLQPFHVLVFSLLSWLPHRLTCVCARIQLNFFGESFICKKNQFQRSN